MDISLNISATPLDPKSKKDLGYKKEFFKPQFKREMKKTIRLEKSNKKQTIRYSSTDKSYDGPTPRVKQKSLAAIVARNLNFATKAGTAASGSDKTTKTKVVDEFNASNQVKVTFDKSGSAPSVKTILARKRDADVSNTEKKSLLDIFGGGNSSSSIDSRANFIKSGVNPPAVVLPLKIEKRKFEEETSEKEMGLTKAKRSKKIVDGTEEMSFRKIEQTNSGDKTAIRISHARVSSSGKVSSLFGNNPEIPNMGQRLVKPINEAVFSGTKFTDFNLHSFTVSNLEQNMNITKLTTVQQMAIPEIMSGKDVLVRSQTGSGKTLAYALPIIESLHKIRPKLTRDSGLKVLVVVPTRELALQTYECFLKLVKPFAWIVPGYLVGGEKRKAEKARLRKGCAVLVATPGRLLDHIKHTEALRLQQVRCFVLDEADRMLDMGYEKDVSGIVAALEEQKGLPYLGVKKIVKTDNNEVNSGGYDPLKMLRQTGRKVFTDEEVERIGGESDEMKKSEIEDVTKNEKAEETKEFFGSEIATPKVAIDVDIKDREDDVEEESEDDDITKKEYHSGTDSDLDEEGKTLPIRVQSHKRIKKKSSVLFTRNNKVNKMIISRPKVEENVNSESSSDAEVEEEKGKDLSEENSSSDLNSNKRQTILLSATLTQAVEKLAGLTMENPVVVDAAKENIEKSGGSLNEINEDLIVPQSVSQSYVVTPPKLRLVSLSAYIAGKCQTAGQHKTLVFMATQDMVDYHADILSSVLCKASDEDDDDSEPLVDADFFKLHGNMTQKERTEVFRTFRSAKSGVLLCTDVAARGLDLPKVDSVVQYTGPLSARDYVHRVGRTARAGSSGSAVIFLTPSEVGFVRMLESRRIRIQQEDMSGMLDKLMGPLSRRNSVEATATALQNQFENLLLEDKDLHKKACKAYVSWIRFYASYPKDMREVFDRRELHLGHYAKSFGLRDPPQKIGGIGKTVEDQNGNNLKRHENRLANKRPDKIFAKNRDGGRTGRTGNGAGPKTNSLKKVRMLNTSEYGSGLENTKKSQKKK